MTSTHDPLRLADVDPLVFTERARGGQIVGALALDIVMPVALLAAGVILFRSEEHTSELQSH